MYKILIPLFSIVFWIGHIGLVFAAPSELELQQRLRVSYHTYLAAKAGMQSKIGSGEIGDAEIADYSDWVEALGNQFGRECSALSRMAPDAVPDDLPCSEFINRTSGPANIDLGSERTTFEATEQFASELQNALEAFDEQLLKEQDRIKANTPRSETTQSSSTGEQASSKESDSDRVKGDIGDSTKTSSQTTDSTQSAASRKPPEDDQKTAGNPDDTATGEVPDNIPDGRDDDVVARQLREAAEKESNPELRKKLWEEYRRYKTGTG